MHRCSGSRAARESKQTAADRAASTGYFGAGEVAGRRSRFRKRCPETRQCGSSYLRQGDKGSGIGVGVAKIGVEAANLFQRHWLRRFFNDFLKARIIA
jgi:hypothetical protein